MATYGRLKAAQAGEPSESISPTPLKASLTTKTNKIRKPRVTVGIGGAKAGEGTTVRF